MNNKVTLLRICHIWQIKISFEESCLWWNTGISNLPPQETTINLKKIVKNNHLKVPNSETKTNNKLRSIFFSSRKTAELWTRTASVFGILAGGMLSFPGWCLVCMKCYQGGAGKKNSIFAARLCQPELAKKVKSLYPAALFLKIANRVGND